MSQNINQIFITNPITSNTGTDLMYFGQSPYGAGNDAGMTYTNFSAQFALSTAIINAAHGGTGVASPTAHGVLVAEGSSPATSIVLGAGQVLIGTTASDPNAATLTQGTGITITSTTGSITIASNGAIPWVDQTSASVTMVANTGYTSDDGANLVTFTLPTASAIGDFVEINGKGTGLWTIAQATGQQIHNGTSSTTSGAGGSLSSVNQFDNVRLRCLTANTIWTVVSQQSSGLTVV